MTKRRMCVIGNSGIACVKQAYDHYGENYPNFDITFYGASAYTVSSLKLSGDGGAILSSYDEKVSSQLRMTSGGNDFIPLKEYDEVVLYGITFEWRDFLRIFRTHCLPSHSTFLLDHQVFPPSTLDALVEDLLQLRPGLELASEIANAVHSDITIAAAPAPAEFVVETPQFRKFSTFTHELMAEIFDIYSSAFTAFCRARGFRPVLQDEETMTKMKFTESRYASGAVGLPQDGDRAIRSGELFREVKASDPWHMNFEFGVKALDRILSR